MITLFAVACIAGSLHGTPHDICRQIPIGSYPSVDLCAKNQKAVTDAWIKELHLYGLDLQVIASECSPASPDDDD